MAEQVTKGILATFGIYESDIHDLERSADELENAYASSQWMKDERTQFATRVRGLKAKGRAAFWAESQGPEGAPLEPVDDTIERLGAAFDLLMRWLELVVRLHQEVKEDAQELARTIKLDLEFKMEMGLDRRCSPKLSELMKRTANQAKELAGK